MATHVRLLQCLDCKTLEELPDYAGDPSQDFLLQALIDERHSKPEPHRGHLHRIETKHWENKTTRRAIENEIRVNSGHTGFDTSFYEAKATFQDDALRCWEAHLRTPDCNDYKSDSKRLSPGTTAARKAAGLPKYRSPKDRYLCEFCPVHSLVKAAAYTKAGVRD